MIDANTPLVSIVMAVFNGEDYLDKAIESMCCQSYKNFEFLIIDDGSKDNSKTIIKQYQSNDSRIRLIENTENIGLPDSLNKGIEAAKGKFIARMDCDDLSFPNRLRDQVHFLETNSDHVLIGAQSIRIDADGRPIEKLNLPTCDTSIRARCLFENPFVHPSVLIRTSTLIDNGIRYRSNYKTTQDWALWIDLMLFGKIANLREPLIFQRVHDKTISRKKRNIQIINSLQIQKTYVRKLLGESYWDPSLFEKINTIFLNDRRTADAHNHDRIETCLTVIKYSEMAFNKVPSGIQVKLNEFIFERCIQFGLFPPFKKGWIKLFLKLMSVSPFMMVKRSFILLQNRIHNNNKM